MSAPRRREVAKKAARWVRLTLRPRVTHRRSDLEPSRYNPVLVLYSVIHTRCRRMGKELLQLAVEFSHAHRSECTARASKSTGPGFVPRPHSFR